jgi:hypothetical protein
MSATIPIQRTEELLARVQLLYANKLTLKEVGNTLGIGYASVRRILIELGISRRPVGILRNPNQISGQRQYSVNAKAKRLTHTQNWRDKNPDKVTKGARIASLRKYGITPEQYDLLEQQQNGLCEICKQVCLTGRRLAVDHDHQTNKLRGLLCSRCNIGLGQFEESIERLQAAADYLRRDR